MEVFRASLKDVPLSRVKKVRQQLSYEFELLQHEHDFANAHIRLRMIAILDEFLSASVILNNEPCSQ